MFAGKGGDGPHMTEPYEEAPREGVTWYSFENSFWSVLFYLTLIYS